MNKTKADIKKGCGKRFTYDEDGEDYICGEEFEYDSGEENDSGCGYLLCPTCKSKLEGYNLAEQKFKEMIDEGIKDMNFMIKQGKYKVQAKPGLSVLTKLKKQLEEE